MMFMGWQTSATSIILTKRNPIEAESTVQALADFDVLVGKTQAL